MPVRLARWLGLGCTCAVVAGGTWLATAREVGAAKTAPGHIDGTMVVYAIEIVPATGPVTLAEVGDRAEHETVHAVHGHFHLAVAPGSYRLSAKVGTASCPSVTVTVRAHATTRPTLRCMGY